MSDVSLTSPLQGRCVVIGVDGSEVSLQALEYVARVLEALRAEAVIVFVRHLTNLLPQEGSATAVELALESIDELEAAVRSRAEKIFAGVTVPWRVVVREGDPAEEILAVAHEEHAGCLAIGSTIHGAVSSVLLSSVAQHLLHHSDISILVVRPETASAS